MPIIIKPKTKQTSDKTKPDLNNKINSKELNFADIKTRQNGTMIINSVNNEERNKIKAIMEKI